tara:strand:- start:284 stop:715 length:432 start_codon:yes stop_codon:yes gene_type:complete
MSSQRVESAFKYKYVTVTSDTYTYEIVADTQLNISVRDIVAPNGQLIDSMTLLPAEVISDIAASILVVKDLLGLATRLTGVATFTSATSVTVEFAEAQNSTDYSVLLDPTDFVAFRVTAKTTVSFTIESSTTYTGSVRWSLFV